MDENRKKHSFAVAERMKEYTKKYPYFGKFLDPDDMFFLGLIHDIGREMVSDSDSRYNDGTGHEEVGAEFLIHQTFIGQFTRNSSGVYQYVEAVRRHGSPLVRPDCRKNVNLNSGAVNRSAFLTERALQLLQIADMTSDYDGTYVTVEERCQRIKDRYGDCDGYRGSLETAKALKEVMKAAGIES